MTPFRRLFCVAALILAAGCASAPHTVYSVNAPQGSSADWKKSSAEQVPGQHLISVFRNEKLKANVWILRNTKHADIADPLNVLRAYANESPYRNHGPVVSEDNINGAFVILNDHGDVVGALATFQDTTTNETLLLRVGWKAGTPDDVTDAIVDYAWELTVAPAAK